MKQNSMNGIGSKLMIAARLLLVVAVVAGGAVYAFTQPGSTPPNGNVPAPVNVGATSQSKAGAFAATALAGLWVQGTSGFCIGPNAQNPTADCITEWPSGGGGEGGGDPFSTTCTINSMLIHGTDNSSAQWGVPHSQTGYVASSSLGAYCMGRLTQAEKDAGWMVASFDNCPGIQGKDCAGVSYCQYIQLQCGEGITFQQGTFTRRSYAAGGGGSGSGTTPPGTETPGPGTRTDSPILEL